MLEKNDATIHAEINCDKQKQKLLIHALLMCSELNLEIMASMLSVSCSMLKNVYTGGSFLQKEHAEKLLHLFLIRFTDSITFVS